MSDDITKQISDKLSVHKVFESLGFSIDSQNKVLCPFHNDTNPSMHLYSQTGQYHCFVCGAHGNIFNIVQKVNNYKFPEAVAFLADLAGISILNKLSRNIINSYKIAFDMYKNEPAAGKKIRTDFARKRGFNPTFLLQRDVFGITGSQLSKSASYEEKEKLLENSLLFEPTGKEASIYKRGDITIDYFGQEAVIFTLKNYDGNIAGYVARAVDENIKPKYKFTRGLKKSSILYRIDNLRNSISMTRKDSNYHLFLVEGVMDVLRLESFGLNAIAILGSKITNNQIKLLDKFSSELFEKKNSNLVVHVFLDNDEAGREGAFKTITSITNNSKNIYNIDIVLPEEEPSAESDPDSILRERDKTETKEYIDSWIISSYEYLILYALNHDKLESLNKFWEELPHTNRQQCYKRSLYIFKPEVWLNIIELESLSHRNYLSKEPVQNTNKTVEKIITYIDRYTRLYLDDKPDELNAESDEIFDENINLLSAITNAKYGVHVNDFHIGNKYWGRIEKSIDVFKHYFSIILKNGKHIKIPLCATQDPKKDVGYRLRAMPCCESLVLQRYMLCELLGYDYYQYEKFIPAVRSYKNSTYTTGLSGNYETDIISYAYQINMSAVKNPTPENAKIFVDYHECWGDFISYLAKGARAIGSENISVIRLDIEKYYDSLPKYAVKSVLEKCFHKIIPDVITSQTFAPLFFTEQFKDIESRKRALVDWYLDESFGYEYHLPGSGKVIRNPPERGIPQGPDLSAYLANIALFPLDEEIAKSVDNINQNHRDSIDFSNKREIVIRCARYVDDIVIISSSTKAINKLVDIIINELDRIGLRLNNKSNPLENLTLDQTLEWLITARGGLGVSAQTDSAGIEAYDALDDLNYSHYVDRSKILLILNSIILKTLEDIDTVRKYLDCIFSCDELKITDINRTTEVMWRYVIKTAESPESLNLPEAAKKFYSLWNECNKFTHKRTSLLKRQDTIIYAALSGIELALNKKLYPSPTTQDHDKEIHKNLELLARCVSSSNNIFNDLNSVIKIENKKLKQCEYDLRLKALKCKKIALSRITQKNNTQIDEIEYFSEKMQDHFYYSMHIASLSEIQQNDELISSSSSQKLDLLVLMHYGISALINAPSVEPKITNNILKDPLSSDAIDSYKPEDSLLLTYLKLWFPPEHSDSTKYDAAIKDIALISFINIVSNRDELLKLLNSRKSLIDTELNEGYSYFPSPTGINYKGIFALNLYEQSFRILELINDDKEDDKDFVLSDNLPINKDQTFKKSNHITLSGNLTNDPDSTLADYYSSRVELGDSNDEISYITQSRDNFSTFFKLYFAIVNLIDYQKETGIAKEKYTYIPTPYSIIVNKNNSVDYLGYHVKRELAGSSVYLKQGNSIIRENVKDNQAGWKYWAAAKLLSSIIQRSYYTGNNDTLENSYYNSSQSKSVAAKMLDAILRRLDRKLTYKELTSDSIKSSIRRTENIITHFTKHFDNKSASLLLFKDITTENKIISLMYTTKDGQRLNGYSAYVFMRSAEDTVRYDKEYFSSIPHENNNKDDHKTLRRPVAAWLRLADIHESIIDSNTNNLNHPLVSIRSIVTGLRVKAISLFFRMLSIDIVQDADRVAIKDFTTKKLDLPYDGLGLTPNDAFYYADTRSNASISDIHSIATKILKKDITESELSKVTPLGWLLIFSWLTGAYSNHSLIFNADAIRVKLTKAIETTAKLLVPTSPKNNNDYPWNIVLPVSIDKSKLKSIFSIEYDLGFKTSLETSCNFNVKRDGPFAKTVAIDTPSGERSVWGASYTVSSINTKRRETEYYSEERSGYKLKIYSITRNNTGKEISYAAISNELSELCSLNPDTSNTTQNRVYASADNNATTSEEDSMLVDKIPGEEQKETETYQTPLPEILPRAEKNIKSNTQDTKEINQSNELSANSTSDDTTHNNNQKGTDKNTGQDTDRESFYTAMNSLEKFQKDSWEKRSKLKDIKTHNENSKSNKHRIAFFQFDIDDSYLHKVSELCKAKTNESEDPIDITYLKKDKPEHINTAGYTEVYSCAEYRRRKLLRKVIDVCEEFRVDALLLPEYSVRPDTVLFLQENLPADYKINIWAGTFKYSEKSEFLQNKIDKKIHNTIHKGSALLPLLHPGEDGYNLNITRAKKYPAQSLEELFNPYNNIIKPICKSLDPVKPDDVKNYVIELICAELFLLTSPINMQTLDAARNKLLERYKNPPKTRGEKTNSDIQDDIESITNYLSLNFLNIHRNPLVFVPAYTGRTADYAITAQAAFLSSGVSTVFCNAVGVKARGQSCFLSKGCWDEDSSGNCSTLPSYDPYHGVRPGIYSQNSKDRGWLGKKEQAVVICDLDVENSFEGKPRPTCLENPIQLVAHLPIIESIKSKSKGELIDALKKCRCDRSKIRDYRSDKIIKRLVELNNIITTKHPSTTTTINDEAPNEIAEIIKDIGIELDNDWLIKRANKYQIQHANNPQKFPPPTALDWIWVDLDEMKTKNDYFENNIHLPPF